MFRTLVATCALSMVLFGPVAAQTSQFVAPAAASLTTQAFAGMLVAAVNTTLPANPKATMTELQAALEKALENTFSTSGVSPDVAVAGVAQAKVTLLRSAVMCGLPKGQATKSCEAVALAFQLAERATSATGATAAGGGGTPVPSATVGGGGGGGVTHPPVAG